MRTVSVNPSALPAVGLGTFEPAVAVDLNTSRLMVGSPGFIYTDTAIVLTTGNSATAKYATNGLRNVSMFLVLTGGTPGVEPVIQLQASLDGTNWANVSGATITPTGAGTFMVSATVSAPYIRAIVTTAASGGTAYTLGYVGFGLTS